MRPIRDLIYLLLLLPLKTMGGSSLVIKLASPQPVMVVVDYELFTASSILVVPQLSAGLHSVTIMQRTGPQGRMHIMLDEQISLIDRLESVYRVEHNKLRLIQTRPQKPDAQIAVCQLGQPGAGLLANGIPAANWVFAMSEEQLDGFIRVLNRQTFDDSKIQYALTYLSNAWLTSAQILRIVKQLTFDDNKLELATALYHHAIDPVNYYLVETAFSFRSTGQKLQEYLRKNR